jgi:Na+-transporting methylmalonyl-CoA/oxaloacetate decarboxylase gamma subunit
MVQNRKVTFMKKKLFLIVSICLCILGMTACTKTDPKTTVYNGQSYADLQKNAQDTVVALAKMSDADKAKYSSGDNKVVADLIKSWNEETKEAGEYVGCNKDGFNITKSDDTLTTTQTVQFKQKSLTVSFVFKASTMEIQKATVGQLKDKTNIALNIWIIIGIAAIALAVIILLFFGIKSAMHSKDESEPSDVFEDVDDNKVVNQIAQREQADLELTAVIAAAISASTGVPTDGFVVRSIKRRK